MSDVNETTPPPDLYRFNVEEYDRSLMAQIYAASGIPVYWVLNLADQQIEVFKKPAADHYEARDEFHFGQEVPLVIQGQSAGVIPVEDVLP